MRVTSLSLALAALFVNNALVSALPDLLHKRLLNDALASASKHAAASATSSAVTAASSTEAATSKQKSSSSKEASSGSVDVSSKLLSAGFKAIGQNSQTNNGQCWLGSDGPNTNVIKNGASESIVVVVWGAMGSWMTDASKPPLITISLGAGQSQTISCADVTGGMAALYGGTTLSPYGQVFNTWVEFTYGQWGTVDVSREVRMDGNPVSVVGSKCTTDMSTCVFECKSGNTCGDIYSYQIKNCGPHNNGQASSDLMNGGCLMGSNAQLTTTFS